MVYMIGARKEYDQYPEEKFLDGEPAEVWVADEVNEVDRVILMHDKHRYLLGRRVDARHVPTIWQWKSKKPVPDYYNPHAFPCISSKIKAIIEEFEPGVHQFFPLQVVDKSGAPLAVRWLWVVCNNLDSVNREHTNLLFYNEKLWTPEYKVDDKWVRISNPKIVYSKELTQGRHFWRDTHLMGNSIYTSDEAGDALMNAGLTGLGGSRQEAV